MSTISKLNPAEHSSSEPQGGTFTTRLKGNVLSTNAQEVRTKLTAALSDPRSATGALQLFELDVTEAQMIDSVGLNLLVWLLKAVRERGARLRLLISSVHVERTLQFTRLDQQAEVVRRS